MYTLYTERTCSRSHKDVELPVRTMRALTSLRAFKKEARSYGYGFRLRLDQSLRDLRYA